MKRIDLRGIFDVDAPVVGMLHLPPLPGSPGWDGSMDQLLDRALVETRLLEDGGVDGILVENYGDVPYVPGSVPAETVPAMARVTAAVVDAISLPVGVNVLRNDARAALGVALASEARFTRVNVHAGVMFTDQGIVEGRAHETLRARQALDAPVAILADVMVKHATPPSGLTDVDAAGDLWERGRADGLIVSGPGTGRPVDRGRLLRIRDAVPDAPVWIGSGVEPRTVPDLLPHCDGMIVGSALQEEGRAGAGVQVERVRRLMEAVKERR